MNHPDPPIAPAVADAVDIFASLRDALIEACGFAESSITSAADGAIVKALRDLHAVGADPTSVPAAAARFRQRFPAATLTPLALAKHWPALVDSTPASSGLTVTEADRFGWTLGLTVPDEDMALRECSDEFPDREERSQAFVAWRNRRGQMAAAG